LLEVAKLENESQTKVSNAFLDLHRQQHLAMHDLAKVENEGSAKTSNAFLDLYEKSVARLRSLEARVDTLEMTTRAQTRTAANRAKRKPGRKGKT
jgi:hypothetical protein